MVALYHLGCTTLGSPSKSDDLSEQQIKGTSTNSFLRAIDPFPVLDKKGNQYHTVFSGGFNVPRPQFVDIDDDKDLDLFLLDPFA